MHPGFSYRSWIALGCVLSVLAPATASAGSSGTSLEFRGVALRLPGTWHQRVFPRISGNALDAVTVGNVRPGRPEYLLGHNDPRFRWSPGVILISVIDWTGRQRRRVQFPTARLPLRVAERNVGGFEGIRTDHAFVRLQIRVECKWLEIWVQFGRRLTTRQTVARANAALSSLVLVPGACSSP